MRLKDKVAFISGGARGIGAAIAKLFAREGAKVVIGDVLEEEGRKTETEINETGGESLFLRMDVTSEDEWQQAVASTLARFGKLDVLVNNAGIGDTGKVEDTTVEQWDRVMDVNLKGTYLASWHAVPEMKRFGGGSIVNLSSIMGLVGYPRGMGGGFNPYPASKGGIVQLTKSMAIDLAPDNVRVNCVCPGGVETPLIAGFAGPEGFDPDLIHRLSLVPGLTAAGEIAEAIAYLASPAASSINGVALPIDFGTHAA